MNATDLNITAIVAAIDPFDYARSVAEAGPNAGPDSWRNACTDALALFGEQFDREGFDQYFSGFGAWSDEELAAHSDQECAALMLQFIAGDLRECEVLEASEQFSPEWWQEYETLASAGTIGGRIGRGDDGQIYFYYGN